MTMKNFDSRTLFISPLQSLGSVLSCALLLLFSGLKCLIFVTQSPKYTRLKRITNQFSFVYTVVKSLYIDRVPYFH